MRRRELVKKINKYAKANGLDVNFDQGKNHTKVTLGTTGRSVIPRHNEINELTARAIFRQLGMEE